MTRSRVAIFSAAVCIVLVGLGLFAATTEPSATVPTTNSIGPSSRANILSTQPSTSAVIPIPTPSVSAATHGDTMPRQYLVLLSRSMFVRGHVAEAGHAGGRNLQRTNASPTTAPSLQRAETGLVFNGVTQTTTTIDALVEDTSTGRVLTVHPGDAIARGTVGKITMDSLQYLSDGRTTEVRIGQNLAGSDGDVSASPATSQPAASGASPQDILERLRQKRLQELGGK